MNPSLGYRFLNLAKRAGVMSEGYAWIITNSLSIFMNDIDSATHDSMEGVLGIRPHVPTSKELRSFQKRWMRTMNLNDATGSIMDLNVNGLWAYDTVTTLATALEKIGPLKSSTLNTNTTENGTYDRSLRISTFGPQILKGLSSTKFRGLSGDFELVDGKLKPSALEIFNVIGSGEKTVGFWTSEREIVRDLSSINGETKYSTSIKGPKQVTWPEDSVTQPKGWLHLRVGVPWKLGYTEFVNVFVDPTTGHTNATGFSIDIFLATLNLLPFPITYEFVNCSEPYDDIRHEIPEKIDMAVGDTTIWAPRATYVDFSLPYFETGVILVVKNKKPFDMWIFIKPLTWDLWLAIFISCALMGIVLRILEYQMVSNVADPTKPPIYWSPVAVLAFPERNMVANKWSFLVLVVWLFMAFILMQSYTANLSAILTVDQLKFASSDDYYIGWQEGSFMFLTKQLRINASRLKAYSSAEEYHEAMSKGSKDESIDAIFDEIPYMKILLKKYDSQYKMVGPTYWTGGFGFAFPVGSPLAAHFSKAILNVTQGPNMSANEKKNFGPGYSSQDPLSSTISQQTSNLTLYDFAGLFLIIESVTVFALFCSETPIGRKLSDKTGHFIHNCFRFWTSRFNATETTSVESDEPVQKNVIGEGTDANVTEHGEDKSQEIGIGDETSNVQNLEMRVIINEERNS